MTDTLSALDAMFLELEQHDEGATMHIGGVMVFEAPPDGKVPTIDAIRAHLLERLNTLPRYSQRLSNVHPGGLAWPHWLQDPDFDIHDHVRRAALPAPGGDAELCDWAADFFSHRLDRTRPLWEMTLIEGLPERRWALATKTHHCLVDGVGSVDVATLLLDVKPSGSEPPRQAAQATEDEPSTPWRSYAPHPPALLAGATQTGVHALAAGVHAALHPREALSRSRSLAELVVHDELVGAPQSSINVPIGATRRYKIVRIPLAELQTIGHAHGGTVNDVLLAACTAGLRALLLARGEIPSPKGLRAMVPMNVRSASEHLALGNRISSLFVQLPVDEPDPHLRLHAIAASTRRLKSSRAAEGASAMLDLAGLAPPVLHAMIARSLYATRLFNVTITNVPGPQLPLYALGAQMVEVHPLVPLAAEHAVGVASFSYNGHVVLGVSGDRVAAPDLHVLAGGIADGLGELRALAGDPDRVKGRAPAETQGKARRRAPSPSPPARTTSHKSPRGRR